MKASAWIRGLLVCAAIGLSCGLFIGAPPADAVPATAELEHLEQPDGGVIWVRQIGDEWGNGLRTHDGYHVLRDPKTGYWVYAAEALGGGIRPSALVVGRDLPAGIPKGLGPARVAPAAPLPQDAISAGALAPSIGAHPVLVIFVDFTPSARVGSTAPSWSARLTGAAPSVRDYYEHVSYGAFSFGPATESDTALGGSVNDGVVSVTLSYAHPDTGGAIGDPNRQIARDALIAADPSVDFASFDRNGDGTISTDELHIVVVVAGYERSYSSSPCGPSVWGHRWGLGGSVKPPTLDGKVVGRAYTQFGEWHCASSFPPGHQATIGIIVHELGHDLGLPDLYDTDGSSEGIGRWGVMGSGSWNQVSLRGDSPSHMDPWSKFQQGWLTPIPVTTTLLNETIAPVETSPDVYQILSGTPSFGEYFLVENRQLVGYDAGLPAAGLLIWHVDAAKAGNTEECSPEGPSCAQHHYKVAVVQADGLYQLEMGTNRGDAGDPWPGSTENRVFDDASSPNSHLYDGTASGVSVTDIALLGAGGSVRATLTPSQGYVLTVLEAGTGSGSVTSVPTGIACGSDCVEEYHFGTSVTLTAGANPNAVFASWSVDGGACPLLGNGGLSCTLTMTQAWRVTATFNLPPPLPVQLTIIRAGSADGSVTSTPAGLDCGPTCTASFPSGSLVTLSASAAPGAVFREWRGACAGVGTNPICRLTPVAAAGVTAVFSKAFTDEPLVAGSTPVKAAHIAELRAAIDTLRARRDLSIFPWTDPSPARGSTPIRAVHLTDLRTALGQAYQAAGRTAPVYTDPTLTPQRTAVKAVHLQELRTAVRALE